MKPDKKAINRKDLGKSQMVMIKWNDATSVGRWRSELPDPHEQELCAHCCSVGFPIHEDKKCIVLAQTIGNDGSFLDTIAIPKPFLASRSRIKVEPVEKRPVKRRHK